MLGLGPTWHDRRLGGIGQVVPIGKMLTIDNNRDPSAKGRKRPSCYD